MQQCFIDVSGKKSQQVEIGSPDGRHLLRVLKKTPGDLLWIVDALGVRWKSKITEVRGENIFAELLEKSEETRNPVKIRLVTALPKGDRLKWMIEKCCEAGVDEIIPLQSSRTVRVWGNKEYVGQKDKWQKRLLSSSKQSLRTTIPHIKPPITFNDIITIDVDSYRLILTPPDDKTISLLEYIRKSKSPDRDIYLLLGPEGGWSKEELSLAKRNNWTSVHLGRNILRIETAGLFAVQFASLWSE